MLQRSNKKRSLPIYFRGDCKTTDAVETANTFNLLFTNIGQDLANKTKNTFQEINGESLIKIIDKFPAKASSGHDSITLKQLLLNQIFNTGIFPDKMKIASHSYFKK